MTTTYLCLVFSLVVSGAVGWRQVSKCTKTAVDPFGNGQEGVNAVANTLELDCGSDLIFIAWSHYGHRASHKARPQTAQSSFLEKIVPHGKEEG